MIANGPRRCARAAIVGVALLGPNDPAPRTAAPRTAVADAPRDGLPTVRANDNRVPAGTLRDGVLTVRLVVRMARWYPEAAGGPSVVAPAFAEEGRAPQIPAPLLRVRAGTTIVATVRNALPDSTITVHGLHARPGAPGDTLVVPPGASRTVRLTAGAPGTYLYLARLGAYTVQTGPLDRPAEREQLGGAFVVDAPGARTDDRVLVLNIWGDTVDSAHYRNALTINGRSWPHGERHLATVGDSVRWRVVNATARVHPMHLHGFYFRVESRGTLLGDTAYAPPARRLAVTEEMRPFTTMTMAWAPNRPGNWIFHCHLAFHTTPETRLDATPGHRGHGGHASAGGEHMGGLVVGINVRAGRGWVDAPRAAARTLRLHVNEGPRRGRAERALGYVLQEGARAPARDSVEIPGTVLVLTRDQPTDVTVVNNLREPTAVHWHGIELESYSDGVAGWSGAGRRLAPMIAPADSFVARLTLPRAGTFIYHTHLNDIEQLTSGLYGALVVLEPGQRFDPATDHVFVLGWDGDAEPARALVNGDSLPPPLVIAAGVRHRFRFVNIGAAGRAAFSLRRDTTLVEWRAVAKDGADLPSAQATRRRAVQPINVGETFDFEVTPTAGDHELRLTAPGLPTLWARRVIVR